MSAATNGATNEEGHPGEGGLPTQYTSPQGKGSGDFSACELAGKAKSTKFSFDTRDVPGSKALLVDHVEAFRQAMEGAGLTPPGRIVDDGAFHRFTTNGRRKDQAGWYILRGHDIPSGCFGDWRTGLQHEWCSKDLATLTSSERAANDRRIAEARSKRHAEQAKAREQVKALAQIRWEAASAEGSHNYLQAKGVGAHGVRFEGDRLLVPMRDELGQIHSLQTINQDGEKRYMADGRKHGCFHVFGPSDGPIVICEGYATGASIYEATGLCVAVAFDAGGLEPAARALHRAHPSRQIVVASDDDWKTEANPGATKAAQAAATVGGMVVTPIFGEDRAEKDTDFNDLAKAAGLLAVRDIFEVAGIQPRAAIGATNPLPEAGEANGGAVVASGASEVQAPVARKVFRAGEFMSEMTPKFWILQRVLAKGWLYALAASPGAGKTAVALLLTLRAAMGREFMGRKVTKSKVLYLCGENPQDVRGRFDALLRKHEMTLADVDGQVFFTQSPFNIDDRQDLDAFIADAQQHGPFDLCIIDTQKAHSGAEDENDTSGQHELAQAMRRLGAGIGDPCILTLSHPTKNAGKDNLLPRGGSSFTGSIDGVLCLWREGRGAPSEMFSHRDKFRGKAFEGEFFKMDEVEHPTLLDNFGDADVTVVASELTGQADISGILKAVDNGNTAIVMDKIREACLRGELLSKTAWATELGKKSDYLHVLNGLVTSGQLVGVPCQGALVGKRQGLDVLVPQSVSVDVAFLAAAERQLAAPGIEDEKKEELQRIVQSITERGQK
jgi:phage/plasmid primase-like uncharacterized protein